MDTAKVVSQVTNGLSILAILLAMTGHADQVAPVQDLAQHAPDHVNNIIMAAGGLAAAITEPVIRLSHILSIFKKK